MAPKITVVREEITQVSADMLLLKHAQSFYGADEAVALRLTNHGACQVADISPAEGQSALVPTQGAIAASAVLFLGVPPLGDFRYREMRLFARQGIEVLAKRNLPVRRLATTIHGAGYGLDIEEATRSLILGFQQGLTTHPLAGLEELLFVERNPRRYEVLTDIVAGIDLVVPDQAVSPGTPATVLRAEQETARKSFIFVAMPFSEDSEDVYQFGIYNAVRRCGYICEKVDESAFAGSIVDRITDGIRNATCVVADLSLERPNVYLEVGFAWGLQRPVILVAREGQRLHFDLSHHKCIFYRTIGKLADSLEKVILEMFGRGNDQGNETFGLLPIATPRTPHRVS